MGWCTGKTQRDWVEREVGGGIGIGNTYKSKLNFEGFPEISGSWMQSRENTYKEFFSVVYLIFHYYQNTMRKKSQGFDLEVRLK